MPPTFTQRRASVTMTKPSPSEPSAPCPVAVVVTVYNKAPYVRACIESVLAQSCRPLELVIVDDGSTDGSWEIVHAAAAGRDATLLRLANGGVSKARNVGFTACRTRPTYLLFLDGDDVLLPDALQTMVAHMDQYAAVAMCYSIPILIDDAGTVLGTDPDQVRWAATKRGRRRMLETEVDTPIEGLWSHFRAMPSACLVRRSSYEQTKGWDESLCRPARPFQAEDKDMAIQLALTGPIHRLDTPTVNYRVLPTAHRHALYEGLLAVDTKWWNASVSPEARRRIRGAIRFDSLVVLLDAVGGLRRAFRSGSVSEIIAAHRTLLRASVRWACLPLRLRQRSPAQEGLSRP